MCYNSAACVVRALTVMDEQRSNNRKQGKSKWSSVLGWLIFGLVIAWGPISRLLSQLFGGALPSNLFPLIMGGLVILSIVVPAVAALLGKSRLRNDERLPTDPPSQRSRPKPSTPPFQAPREPTVPAPSPQAFVLPRRSASQLPPPPQFEPLINPKLLALGLVGIILLGGLALVLFLPSLP